MKIDLLLESNEGQPLLMKWEKHTNINNNLFDTDSAMVPDNNNLIERGDIK